MTDSIKLAQIWTDLYAIKDTLDNRIIPVAGYLGLEDADLMIALEELSEKIENHFDQFKLIAVTRNE